MTKFKFNPAKRSDRTTPTNGERAAEADLSARTHPFARTDGKAPAKADFENAVDVISDLFHLADREGWEVGELTRVATNNWQDER
jgi:hypothetical protein